MSRQHINRINKDRKSQAEVRRARMQKLSALGKTAAEIATVEGVAVGTVYNNLSITRKESPIKAGEIRAEADGVLRGLSEFAMQSEEMTDAEIVAAVRGCWQDLTKLHGAAEPTRAENVNVNVDAQVIPIEKQLLVADAFAGLYDDEWLEELDKTKARKRTCRVTLDGDVFAKQLPESTS